MVCVRPALANGLVFNGGGEFSANVIGLTPEPVGARGYADGAIALLLFVGDTAEELPIFVACCKAAGRAPFSTAAAAVFTPLSNAELPLVSAPDGDCAFCLTNIGLFVTLSLPAALFCASLKDAPLVATVEADLPTVLVPSGLGKRKYEPLIVCSNLPCLNSLITRVAWYTELCIGNRDLELTLE